MSVISFGECVQQTLYVLAFISASHASLVDGDLFSAARGKICNHGLHKM